MRLQILLSRSIFQPGVNGWCKKIPPYSIMALPYHDMMNALISRLRNLVCTVTDLIHASPRQARDAARGRIDANLRSVARRECCRAEAMAQLQPIRLMR
ncbi:MAG TPA: hypothetical protein VK436_14300 [Methanocella sp.]|nr:hypothetical protein [Methanocella sp.]